MKSADLKQSGFKPMLKSAFKRNILLFVLAQLFSVLVSILIATGNLTRKPEKVADVTAAISMEVSIFLTGISIIMSLIAVYLQFRELFSRRSSDFLLALPVTRQAYFNANILFGIINIAVSYVLSFAVILFIVKSNLFYPSEFFLFNIGWFALYMFMLFLAATAVLFIFAMCAAISGRKWHFFLLSYFAVSSAFSAVAGITAYINTIWGLKITKSYAWIFSPLAGVLSDADEKPSKLVLMCVAFAVQGLLAFAAGYIAFKRRKAEVAETSLFGKILPPALITIFFIAECFSALSLTKSIYLNIAISVVVLAISAIIVSALFYKKVMHKLTLKCVIISLAIAAVAVCGVEFLPKATGYIDYVPESSEVESVTLTCGEVEITAGELPVLSSIITDLIGDRASTYQLITDEAKNAVTTLHKKMAAKETKETYESSNIIFDMLDYSYDAENNISLEYKLKDGSIVKRAYSVNASAVTKEFADFIRTDEAMEQVFFDEDEILFVRFAEFIYDDVYEYVDVDEDEDSGYIYIQLDDYSKLLSCLQEDLKTVSDDDLLMNLNTGFDSDYYTAEEMEEYNEKYLETEDRDETDEDYGFDIMLYAFNDSISAAEKEKLLKMSPEEMDLYNDNYWQDYNSAFDGSPLVSSDIFLSDRNSKTIQYFESKGYTFHLK